MFIPLPLLPFVIALISDLLGKLFLPTLSADTLFRCTSVTGILAASTFLILPPRVLLLFDRKKDFPPDQLASTMHMQFVCCAWCAACILLSVMTPMIDATGANVHVLVAFWNASWTGALTAFIVAWLYNSRLYKDAAAEAKKAEEKQESSARGGSRA